MINFMAHLVRNGGLEALKSDPFVDFTVRCVDREWKVHRTTLCGDSLALQLHCTQMMEAEKRELDLHEADPKAAECLLTYQYLGSYKDYEERPPRQPYVSSPDFEDSQTVSGDSPNDSFSTPIIPCPSPPIIIPTSTWTCANPSPPIPTLEPMDTDTITAILLLNINVFELAQRFSLPSLESYAITKLLSKERYFPHSHLHLLLSLIFEVTTPDCTKLRYPIFQRLVANHTIIQSSFPKAVEQLETHISIAWRHALKSQTELTDMERNMRRQQSSHESEMHKRKKASRREIKELKSTIRIREAKIDDMEEEIRNMEAKLERSKRETKRLRTRFDFWSHA